MKSGFDEVPQVYMICGDRYVICVISNSTCRKVKRLSFDIFNAYHILAVLFMFSLIEHPLPVVCSDGGTVR
jgi:hypothetical protein